MNYREYFEGKRITVMGLGLLGRGVGVTRFLYESGAELTVTDLKTEEQLKESLDELSDLEGITYVLGEHRREDFRDRDMVIKAAGVPKDSEYIQEANNNGVPVKMDASLFCELAPEGVTVVGITGTRGKSTVTQALFHTLQQAGRKAMLGGNVRGVATLPLLERVERGDIVVLELDSWQLQGFGDSKISPHISVFTTFYEDHLNYYSSMEEYFADKANIFKYQDHNDVAVFGYQMTEYMKQYGYSYPHNYVIVDVDEIPLLWDFNIEGEHNIYNLACAKEVLEYLDIDEQIIQKGLESFKGVPGRLEFLFEKSGVKIFNDNNATTASATIAALKALGKDNNVVLILGGTDKGDDKARLLELIPTYCKTVVLYPGSGTDHIREAIQSLEGIDVQEGETLKACVDLAWESCEEGDTLLFSPAFSSFGKEYKNEYDRNDQFVSLVRNLS